MIDPWWPLVTLAAIQVVDAVLCWKPVGFIRECLMSVGFPRRFWRVLPPLKLAAATGLVIGIWMPWLAALTSSALVGYFLVAVAAHIRAGDIGRDLLVNATGMLVICGSTLVFVLRIA